MKAKLIIRDECNVKIENLELSTRKKLSDRFKFEIPGVRYTPAVRLGRWDGKVSFFSIGGSTFINLLPDIIQVLSNEGYDIDLQDQRDYSKEIVFDTIKEDTFAPTVDKPFNPRHLQQMLAEVQQGEFIPGGINRATKERFGPT